MTLDEMQKMVADQLFALDARTDAFVQYSRQVRLEGGEFRNVLNLRDFTLALADFIESMVERGILTRKYG